MRLFTKSLADHSRNICSMAEWHTPKRRVWTKLISLLISVTFLFPYLTWAFESDAFPAPAHQVVFNGRPIEIPAKLGTITKSFQGQDRLVVHIQDLHCNYEVQNNIAGIIDIMGAKHGLKMVAIEGASRPVNTTKLGTFPVQEVKESVGKYLVRQGQIGGPEYYAAIGRHKIILEGVETKELYQHNLATVRSFLNFESQGYCYDLREVLEELKEHIYNPPLKHFDGQRLDYREGRLSILKYCVALFKYGRRHKLDLSRFPNLGIYIQKQKSIFPIAVDSEGLYREMEQLDQAIRASLYSTPAQRELDELCGRVDIVEKLINVSASSKELAEFHAQRGDFAVKAFLSFIQQHDPENEFYMDPEIYALDRYLEKVENFYAVAEKRSEHFVKNILSGMQRHGENLGILVAGGFHTEGVLEALRAQGISYVSVQPRLLHADIVNPYFRLLQNRRTPLEKLLTQNQNLISVPLNNPQVATKHTETVISEKNLAKFVTDPAERARVRTYFNLTQLMVNCGLMEFLANRRVFRILVKTYLAYKAKYPANFEGLEFDFPGKITSETIEKIAQGEPAVLPVGANFSVVMCMADALKTMPDTIGRITFGNGKAFVVMTNKQIRDNKAHLARHAITGQVMILPGIRLPQSTISMMAVTGAGVMLQAGMTAWQGFGSGGAGLLPDFLRNLGSGAEDRWTRAGRNLETMLDEAGRNLSQISKALTVRLPQMVKARMAGNVLRSRSWPIIALSVLMAAIGYQSSPSEPLYTVKAHALMMAGQELSAAEFAEQERISNTEAETALEYLASREAEETALAGIDRKARPDGATVYYKIKEVDVSKICVVIMAGGGGTRGWPASTGEKPKQFRSFGKSRETMLEKTVKRAEGMGIPKERIFISTRGSFEQLVIDSVSEDFPRENIIAEPAKRDTAPAIALCLKHLEKKIGEDATAVFLPADHVIPEEKYYHKAVMEAAKAAQNGPNVVTIGIEPWRAAPEFGYIENGEPSKLGPRTSKCNGFVEKPKQAKAQELLDEGNFDWNAAMDVMNVGTALRAYELFAPEIARRIDIIGEAIDTPEEQKVLNAEYRAISDESAKAFAYMIQEPIALESKKATEEKRNSEISLNNVTGKFKWEDEGNWGALTEKPDESGNQVVGLNYAEVELEDTKNSVVYAGKGMKIKAEGLSGYVVIVEDDVVLVMPKDQATEIKKIVEMLKEDPETKCYVDGEKGKPVTETEESLQKLAGNNKFQGRVRALDSSNSRVDSDRGLVALFRVDGIEVKQTDEGVVVKQVPAGQYAGQPRVPDVPAEREPVRPISQIGVTAVAALSVLGTGLSMAGIYFGCAGLSGLMSMGLGWAAAGGILGLVGAVVNPLVAIPFLLMGIYMWRTRRLSAQPLTEKHKARLLDSWKAREILDVRTLSEKERGEKIAYYDEEQNVIVGDLLRLSCMPRFIQQLILTHEQAHQRQASQRVESGRAPPGQLAGEIYAYTAQMKYIFSQTRGLFLGLAGLESARPEGQKPAAAVPVEEGKPQTAPEAALSLAETEQQRIDANLDYLRRKHGIEITKENADLVTSFAKMDINELKQKKTLSRLHAALDNNDAACREIYLCIIKYKNKISMDARKVENARQVLSAALTTHLNLVKKNPGIVNYHRMEQIVALLANSGHGIRVLAFKNLCEMAGVMDQRLGVSRELDEAAIETILKQNAAHLFEEGRYDFGRGIDDSEHLAYSMPESIRHIAANEGVDKLTLLLLKRMAQLHALDAHQWLPVCFEKIFDYPPTDKQLTYWTKKIVEEGRFPKEIIAELKTIYSEYEKDIQEIAAGKSSIMPESDEWLGWLEAASFDTGKSQDAILVEIAKAKVAFKNQLKAKQASRESSLRYKLRQHILAGYTAVRQDIRRQAVGSVWWLLFLRIYKKVMAGILGSEWEKRLNNFFAKASAFLQDSSALILSKSPMLAVLIVYLSSYLAGMPIIQAEEDSDEVRETIRALGALEDAALSQEKDFAPISELDPEDEAYLYKLAKDTYSNIDYLVNPETGLPYDNMNKGDYTSVSNIGIYLGSEVMAVMLKMEDRDTALDKLSITLTSIEKFEEYNGFTRSWHNPDTGRPTGRDHDISILDSGNLAAGLIAVRAEFPELEPRCTALLEKMGWGSFYDSKSGVLIGGYNMKTQEYTLKWLLEDLAADSRMASFLAIASGQVPAKSWDRLNRPEVARYGVTYMGPDWVAGGGLFMQTISGLFLDERGTPMGNSAANLTWAQIQHAEEIGSPVWGWSASDSPAGYLGMGEIENAVITPHASALGIDYYPHKVVENLRALEAMGLRDTQYGFGDAINVETGKKVTNKLVLDQGMLFLSIGNHLTKGEFRKNFNSDPMVRNGIELIADYQDPLTPEEKAVYSERNTGTETQIEEAIVEEEAKPEKEPKKSELPASLKVSPGKASQATIDYFEKVLSSPEYFGNSSQMGPIRESPGVDNYWTSDNAEYGLVLIELYKTTGDKVYLDKLWSLYQFLKSMETGTGTHFLKHSEHMSVNQTIADNGLVALAYDNKNGTSVLRGHELYPGVDVKPLTVNCADGLSDLSSPDWHFDSQGSEVSGGISCQKNYGNNTLNITENYDLPKGKDVVVCSRDIKARQDVELHNYTHTIDLQGNGSKPYIENSLWIPGSDKIYHAKDLTGPGGSAVDITKAYKQAGGKVLVIYEWDKTIIINTPVEAEKIILHSSRQEGGQYDWADIEIIYPGKELKANEILRTEKINMSVMWNQLLSQDGENHIPDEVENLLPKWLAMAAGEPDYLSYQTDYGYLGAGLFYAESALFWKSIGEQEKAEQCEASARKIAEYAYQTCCELSFRTDIMPSYASGRYYAYHGDLFEALYELTGEERWLSRELAVGKDMIEWQYFHPESMNIKYKKVMVEGKKRWVVNSYVNEKNTRYIFHYDANNILEYIEVDDSLRKAYGDDITFTEGTRIEKEDAHMILPGIGLFRGNEDVNSEIRLDVQGQNLAALYKTMKRAEESGELDLAGKCLKAAILLIHDGIKIDDQGAFYAFQSIDPDTGEAILINEINLYGQANMLYGLSFWAGEFEKADELYREGSKYYDNQLMANGIPKTRDGSASAETTLLAARALLNAPEKTWIEKTLESIPWLGGTFGYSMERRMFGGLQVPVLGWDIVPGRETYVVRTDKYNNEYFIYWNAVPQATIYEVREYKEINGQWGRSQSGPGKDKQIWRFTNNLEIEKPEGGKYKYVIIPWTKQDIEKYGPKKGPKLYGRDAKPITAYIDARPTDESSKQPIILDFGILPDWLGNMIITGSEALIYPRAITYEWRLQKGFPGEENTPILTEYTDGLQIDLNNRDLEPGCDYFISVRGWTGEKGEEGTAKQWKYQGREEADHFIDKGNTTVAPVERPAVITDIKVSEAGNEITWEGTAKWYKIDTWVQKFDADNTVLEEKTTYWSREKNQTLIKPANRARIAGYSDKPENGGQEGESSGNVEIKLENIPEPPEFGIDARTVKIEGNKITLESGLPESSVVYAFILDDKGKLLGPESISDPDEPWFYLTGEEMKNAAQRQNNQIKILLYQGINNDLEDWTLLSEEGAQVIFKVDPEKIPVAPQEIVDPQSIKLTGNTLTFEKLDDPAIKYKIEVLDDSGEPVFVRTLADNEYQPVLLTGREVRSAAQDGDLSVNIYTGAHKTGEYTVFNEEPTSVTFYDVDKDAIPGISPAEEADMLNEVEAKADKIRVRYGNQVHVPYYRNASAFKVKLYDAEGTLIEERVETQTMKTAAGSYMELTGRDMQAAAERGNLTVKIYPGTHNILRGDVFTEKGIEKILSVDPGKIPAISEELEAEMLQEINVAQVTLDGNILHIPYILEGNIFRVEIFADGVRLDRQDADKTIHAGEDTHAFLTGEDVRLAAREGNLELRIYPGKKTFAGRSLKKSIFTKGYVAKKIVVDAEAVPGISGELESAMLQGIDLEAICGTQMSSMINVPYDYKKADIVKVDIYDSNGFLVDTQFRRADAAGPFINVNLVENDELKTAIGMGDLTVKLFPGREEQYKWQLFTENSVDFIVKVTAPEFIISAGSISDDKEEVIKRQKNVKISKIEENPLVSKPRQAVPNVISWPEATEEKLMSLGIEPADFAGYKLVLTNEQDEERVVETHDNHYSVVDLEQGKWRWKVFYITKGEPLGIPSEWSEPKRVIIKERIDGNDGRVTPLAVARITPIDLEITDISCNDASKVPRPKGKEGFDLMKHGGTTAGNVFIQGRTYKGEDFAEISKPSGGANPQVWESEFGSDDKLVKFYKRSILVPHYPVTINTLHLDEPTDQDFIMPIAFEPALGRESVEITTIILEGIEYTAACFANGQFMAVRTDDLDGWYLGPDAQAARDDPSLANNKEAYHGPAEKAVFYLKGHGTASLNVYMGISEKEGISAAMQRVPEFLDKFETAHQGYEQDGEKSEEWARFMVEDVLLDYFWDDKVGTITEIPFDLYADNPNTLWPSNKWTGNSAETHLVLTMYREMVGNKVIHGHELDYYIQRNFEFLESMMTPSGSAYLRMSLSMRLYENEHYNAVLMDNSLTAVEINKRFIYLRQGYEPLGAFTVGGGQIVWENKLLEISDYNQFSLKAHVPELPVPTQEELSADRQFDLRDGDLRVEEIVGVTRGIRGMETKYRITNTGGQPRSLGSYSHGTGFLQADEYVVTNPEGHLGITNTEVGLWIPGIDKPLYAREMIAEAIARGIAGEDVAEEVNRQINEMIRETETDHIVFFGWDKFAVMYSPAGMAGEDVSLHIDFGESPLDEDTLIEWEGAQLVFSTDKTLQPGETFEGKPVFFSHHWAPLSLKEKDENGLPNGLPTERYLVEQWVEQRKALEALEAEIAQGEIDAEEIAERKAVILDGKALDSNYAYPLLGLSLAAQSDYLAGLAREETDPEKKAELLKEAQRVGDLAIKNAVFCKQVYDSSFGKEEYVPYFGIMRFYGYHAQLYAWADKFTQSSMGKDVYQRLLEDENTLPAQQEWYRDLLDYGVFPESVQQEWKKQVEFLAEETLSRGQEGRSALYDKMYNTKYENSWKGEVYRIADAICALQNLIEQDADYGGFKQNEGPSVNQLDDNGYKLVALRIAYDLAREDTNPLNTLDNWERMERYKGAAERNINHWYRITEDGHFWGWQTPQRKTGFDEQQTTYGHVCSGYMTVWADIISRAGELSEAGQTHFTQRHDYVHDFSFGAEVYSFNEEPGDCSDTNSESLPLWLRAMFYKLQGGQEGDLSDVVLNSVDEPVVEEKASGYEKMDLWFRKLPVPIVFWYDLLISGLAFLSVRHIRKLLKKRYDLGIIEYLFLIYKNIQRKLKIRLRQIRGKDRGTEELEVLDRVEKNIETALIENQEAISRAQAKIKAWMTKHITSPPRKARPFWFKPLLPWKKEWGYSTAGTHERAGVKQIEKEIKKITMKIDKDAGMEELDREINRLEKSVKLLKIKYWWKKQKSPAGSEKKLQEILEQADAQEAESNTLKNKREELKLDIQDKIVKSMMEFISGLQADEEWLESCTQEIRSEMEEINKLLYAVEEKCEKNTEKWPLQFDDKGNLQIKDFRDLLLKGDERSGRLLGKLGINKNEINKLKEKTSLSLFYKLLDQPGSSFKTQIKNMLELALTKESELYKVRAIASEIDELKAEIAILQAAGIDERAGGARASKQAELKELEKSKQTSDKTLEKLENEIVLLQAKINDQVMPTEKDRVFLIRDRGYLAQIGSLMFLEGEISAGELMEALKHNKSRSAWFEEILDEKIGLMIDKNKILAAVKAMQNVPGFTGREFVEVFNKEHKKQTRQEQLLLEDFRAKYSDQKLTLDQVLEIFNSRDKLRDFTEKQVLAVMNEILLMPDLYARRDMDESGLDPEIRELLNKIRAGPKAEGKALSHQELLTLNRALLQSFYPDAITPNEKLDPHAGIKGVLERMKNGLQEDTEGRLLREGLLPSFKSHFYERSVMVLQALFISGVILTFNINLWWIIPTAYVGFKIYWPIAHNLVTNITNFLVNPQGHPMLSFAELKTQIDKYADDHSSPYVLPVVIPKFSGKKEEFDDWTAYVKKDIEGLRETTDYLGDNLKIVFVCVSDTFGENLEYEKTEVKELNRTLKEVYHGRITIVHIAVEDHWAFKKPGAVFKFAHLLCGGHTTPDIYINKEQYDPGAKEVLENGKPMFSDIKGDLLSMFGGPGRVSVKRADGTIDVIKTNAELRAAIIAGKKLIIDQKNLPELAWVLDEKNTIPHGHLLKSLRIMFHPHNGGIMLGLPLINITRPLDQEGADISTPWIEEEVYARLVNHRETQVMSWYYGKVSIHFGKSIMRIQDWYRILVAGEALPPRFSLSHDWQEGVLTWAEGLFGSKKTKLQYNRISGTETELMVQMGDKIDFYKLIQDGFDLKLMIMENTEYQELFVFKNILKEYSLFREGDLNLKRLRKTLKRQDKVHVLMRDTLRLKFGLDADHLSGLTEKQALTAFNALMQMPDLSARIDVTKLMKNKKLKLSSPGQELLRLAASGENLEKEDMLALNREILQELYAIETVKSLGKNEILDAVIKERVSGFLGDDVQIGERDLVSFLSGYMRNTRWLPGDLHMIKTIKAYIKVFSPREVYHSQVLERRFTLTPMFAIWVAMFAIMGLTGLATMSNPALGITLLLISITAIILFPNLISPLQYAAVQLGRVKNIRRKKGIRRYLEITKEILLIIYRTLNFTISATLYKTLITLNDLIYTLLAVLKVFKVDKLAAPLQWGKLGNSALSMMERIGFPVFRHVIRDEDKVESYYATFRKAPKIGIVIFLLLFGILGPVGLILTTTLPVGVGIFLTSFILGPLIMSLAAIPGKKVFEHYPLVVLLIYIVIGKLGAYLEYTPLETFTLGLYTLIALFLLIETLMGGIEYFRKDLSGRRDKPATLQVDIGWREEGEYDIVPEGQQKIYKVEETGEKPVKIKISDFSGKEVKTIELKTTDVLQVIEGYRVEFLNRGKIAEFSQKSVFPGTDAKALTASEAGKEKAVEVIKVGGREAALLARTDRMSFSGFKAFTQAEAPLQSGINIIGGETNIAHPHVHTPLDKPKNEILHVISGRIKVNIYTKDGKKLGERILSQGETITLIAGHGLEYMGEETILLEIKQGPYPGAMKDKKIFPREPDQEEREPAAEQRRSPKKRVPVLDKSQQLSTKYNITIPRQRGILKILIGINMMGFTAILFPVLTSTQTTFGQLQVNAESMLPVLAAAFGLAAILAALNAFIHSGPGFTLDKDGKRLLGQIVNLDVDKADLTFGTLSQIHKDQGFLARLWKGVSLGAYREQPGETPTIYVADSIARIIIQSASLEEPGILAEVKFKLAVVLLKRTVNHAMTEWVMPKKIDSALPWYTRIAQGSQWELKARVLNNGVGWFTAALSLGVMILAGLAAAAAGLPIAVFVLASGLIAAGLAYMYAKVTADSFDFKEPAEAQGMTKAEIMRGLCTDEQKYTVAAGKHVAVDPADFMGAIGSLIKTVSAELLEIKSGEISGAEILISDGKEDSETMILEYLAERVKTGEPIELNTLVDFLRNGDFESGSRLRILQIAVREADGQANIAAILENAALACLLKHGQKPLAYPTAALTGELSEHIYMFNTPEMLAHLSKQVSMLCKLAKTAKIENNNVKDLNRIDLALKEMLKISREKKDQQMFKISESVKTNLMPYIRVSAQPSGRQGLLSMGKDFKLKHAVVIEGHKQMELETSAGVKVAMPVAGVYALTSLEKISKQADWLNLVKTGQVKAMDYFSTRCQYRETRPGRSVIFKLLARMSVTMGGNTFIDKAFSVWAMRMNREACLTAWARSDNYSSILGGILDDENSGLRKLMRRQDLDITQFRKLILIALVRVLRENDQDLVLAKDVIKFMGRVAPVARTEAGTINSKTFMLPNMLWAGGMYGALGYLKDYLERLPGIEMDKQMETLIQRRIMRSARQAA